jgi:hypothetical protein
MPTREEVYTAIRNADAAGDSAGVRKLGDYLKTLPAEQSDAAPHVVMDAHRKRLGQIQDELKQIEADKPGLVGSVLGVGGSFLKGAADTALNLGSSMIATPAAGIAGLATTAGNLAAVPFSDVTVDDAVRRGSDVIQKGSQALTYQPRSDVGKQAQQIIAKPFEKLASVADSAGQVVQDTTGSPLLATAVNVGVQSLPALLLKKRIKGGAQIAAEETPATGTAATGTTGTAALGAATETPNVVRAKQYVANNLGPDVWDSLSQSIRDKLSTVAQDATKLEDLDPQALAREIKFQSLDPPVPATRGRLMRDPVALRNEGNVSATEAGRPIRDIDLAANQALLDNLDRLKGKVSGTGKTAATATTPEQTGASVQGAARAKLDFAKATTKRLYDAADASAEGAMPVSAAPLLEWLKDPANARNASFLKSALSDYMDESGNISARNLERIRQEATATANGPPSATTHFAGQARKIIDQLADSSGGELYAKARAARKAQGNEFEQQGAVSDLVSNASRTDRSTALEGTTKAIISGPLEGVRQIKRTLLTGGDEATRTSGRQAWRDVRRQVLEDIKQEATKGVALNPDGSPSLNAGALKRSIDRYGPEKLDEIFGPGTTKQLNKILEVARDAKTQPPTGAVGSSTFANVMAFLEKGLTKVPVGGDLVVGAAKLVGKAREIGAASRETAKATTTPLNEAVKQAAAKSKRERVIGKSEQLDPRLVPLSQVGAQRAR